VAFHLLCRYTEFTWSIPDRHTQDRTGGHVVSRLSASKPASAGLRAAIALMA